MNSQNTIDYISNWIKDYVSSLDFQPVSLVIGVSGGIDSAVTSALCAKTGFKTIAVSMPIKQDSTQHNLSLKHLDWLKKNYDNVETQTIQLDNVFQSFENTIPPKDGFAGTDAAALKQIHECVLRFQDRWNRKV